MLKSITVGNFLSFKDAQTLSLEATRITEFRESVFRVEGEELLNSAVLYGANSSGKSNFLKGISTMRNLVVSSFERSSVAEFEIEPFLLNPECEEKPSFFEVCFYVDGEGFRYGFEVDEHKVHAEWLFLACGEEDEALFLRENDGIWVSEGFGEGEGLEERTRNNALFLSVCDQFNGAVSGKIVRWFSRMQVISGLSHEDYRALTYSLLDDVELQKRLVQFYQSLDLGFEGIQFRKQPFEKSMLPTSLPKEVFEDLLRDLEGSNYGEIKTIHRIFDDSGNASGEKVFDLRKHESSGTNKIIDLSGPFFDTLSQPGVLVIDELDAKLHPLLTVALVNLFKNPLTNPHQSQLIFATHDTNLLSYGKFRRDQIYFVEKNRVGASDLYSLIEYKEEGSTKKVRKDRSYEKDYIAGRYGAIPFLGDFKSLKEKWQEG